MKVFNLHCEDGHGFEGWFASSDDFERQTGNGLLRCPVCDSVHISKLPSAPRLNLTTQLGSSESAPAVLDAVQKVVHHLIENIEDVGQNFAEEVRRIHYDEAPARNIRGVASTEEHRALTEEGIEVIRLPLPLPPKTTLQ